MSWGQLLSGMGGTWANTQAQKRTVKSQLKQSSHQFRANWLLQKEAMRRQELPYRVNEAKRAKIHPLAVLGMNFSSPAPISAGYNPSFNADLGQDISRAGRAVDNIIGRKAADIDLAIKREQLKTLQLQNAGLKKEIQGPPGATIGDSPIDKAFGIPGQQSGASGVIFENVKMPKSKSVGKSSGTGPMGSDYINEHGTLYNLISERGAESLESDLPANMKYTLGKIVDELASLKVAQGPLIAKQKFANIKRALRPKAPKGYEYRWNFTRGAFVLRKKNGTSRFYDHSGRSYSSIPYHKKSYKIKNIGNYPGIKSGPLRR